MKKIAFALAVMSFSVGASATALPQGERTNVSNTDCTLLVEGVNLTLSNQVAGAYACNDETNTIAVTTCHPNGRKPGGTNNFFYTASSAGGGIDDAQDAVCDAEGSAADTKVETAAGIEQEDATANDTTGDGTGDGA
jgi:hypothetical protein